MITKICALLVFVTAASAQATTTKLNIFNQVKLVGYNTPEKDFSINRISLVKVPTLIEIDYNCDEDCSPYEVLESTAAVQVQFSYNDNDNSVNVSATNHLEINFPLALFTKAELSEIKAKSNYNFDLTGKKSLALKKLANQLIGFTSTISSRNAKAIDYEKSDCSYNNDIVEELVCSDVIYKNVVLKSKVLKFSKK